MGTWNVFSVLRPYAADAQEEIKESNILIKNLCQQSKIATNNRLSYKGETYKVQYI